MTATPASALLLPTNLQTVEEFEQWQRQYIHEGSYEFVRGRIIDRGGVPQRHLLCHSFLTRRFCQTESHRQGDTLATRLDSYVSATCLRVPDLSYYDVDQFEAMRRKEKQVTPFAIEILSGSESHQDVLDKVQDYFDGGALLVWYIVPKQQKIYVYTSPDETKSYKGDDVISAGPVLLDFQFTVADLFA